MSLLKKIGTLFRPKQNDRNHWFYVQCDHCGETLKGRVDLFNDLSVQYGEGKNQVSYFCRKVLIGSKRCYRQMDVEFRFDSKRKLVDRQIKGGKFISEETIR